MLSVLVALALLSLYFVVNGDIGLGNYFMLLAILVSTVYDKLGRKRKYNSRTNTTRKKKTTVV
jgi:hypothetical protein